MDVVKQLIRNVMRGFYDKRCVLIMDALLIHSVYVFALERWKLLKRG